jgi:hypothetical protein
MGTLHPSILCGTWLKRIVWHVAHNGDGSSDISRPLLLSPTIIMDYITSENHCYSGAHGMHVGATGAHSSDRPFDISRSLLLPPIVAMGYMTLDDHY